MNQKLLVTSPPPARYTLDEWYLNNRVKYRATQDQHYLADKLLSECDFTREKSAEAANLNKNETNHHLEERIREIEFRKQENEQMRKDILLEIEILNTYKERIMNTMTSLQSEALRICKKCILMREGRLGIDLVHDDVERELLKEVEIIEGVQIMLKRTLEQTHEQLRRMRATIYFIDRDSEDKVHMLKLDQNNLRLKETDLNLSIYHGNTPLASSNITAEEWEAVTNEQFANATKEKNSSTRLRSYIENLLKQVIDDLWNQYATVNEAFRRRIEETKEAKTKLELQHFETVRQVNEMNRVLTSLDKSIAEKEGFMALAHTRLGHRAQRAGLELCRDIVEMKLCNEVIALNENIVNLQQRMAEAEASLRYLLKTQLQLEEDLNIKTNTLQIDEVNCMTLRQSINYHA